VVIDPEDAFPDALIELPVTLFPFTIPADVILEEQTRVVAVIAPALESACVFILTSCVAGYCDQVETSPAPAAIVEPLNVKDPPALIVNCPDGDAPILFAKVKVEAKTPCPARAPFALIFSPLIVPVLINCILATSVVRVLVLKELIVPDSAVIVLRVTKSRFADPPVIVLIVNELTLADSAVIVLVFNNSIVPVPATIVLVLTISVITSTVVIVEKFCIVD